MTENKNPILKAVRGNSAVTKEGSIDKWGNRAAGNYCLSDGLIYKIDQDTRMVDGIPRIIEKYVKLTSNHACLIKEELLIDNGIEIAIVFVIEGRHADGQTLPEIKVPATQFKGLAWILKSWGTKAQIEAHQATARYLEAAILQLSGDVPRTVIRQYTGWTTISDKMYFLTGNGAIDEEGLHKEFKVDFANENLSRYQTPENPASAAQIASVFGLKGIAANDEKVGLILLSCVIRSALAECLPVDFSLFILGASGSYKSELAAITLAFFGKFTARTLTGSWADSILDQLIKSFQTKDVILVLDDFVPGVNRTEAQKMHAKAEAYFRSVGNQSGAGRRNPDHSEKPQYHPRGLTVTTAESLPQCPASLLGRMLVIEMNNTTLDLETLNDFVRRAESEELAAVMLSFIIWLCPKMPELKKTFKTTVRDKRDEIIRRKLATSHARSPDIFAQLFCAMDIFVTFAQNVCAINRITAARIMSDIEKSLINACEVQQTYQKSRHEAETFMSILRSALATGDVHLVSSDGLGLPESNEHAWGWRKIPLKDDKGQPIKNDNIQVYSYCPNGAQIGYVRLGHPKLRDEIWLDPEATLKALQRFASTQGNSFLSDKDTLWKLLISKKYLISTETSKGQVRPLVKRKINYGHLDTRVLVMDPQQILRPHEKDDDMWQELNSSQ